MTPHSTKAQAGRGTRRDMRPPSSLPLPPPPLHPLSRPRLPIQPPPLPSAGDLNIYQRTPCWNSASASVSWWESQTRTHTHARHTHPRKCECTHTHTPCCRTICFEYCGTVEVLSLLFPELRRLASRHSHTETWTHACTHTHSLLLLVSLLYLLSLCPIHLTFH